MKNPLKIAGLREPVDLSFKLEIDEYIPLRFRAFAQPLGCALLRLGDYDRSLIELKVQPGSQLVHGLTLTLAPRLSEYPRITALHSTPGLPILSTEFKEMAVLDLAQNFKVAASSDEILIHWGEIQECEAIQFGRADFLTQSGFLAGARFTNIGHEEMAIFRSHFEMAPDTPRI